MQSGFGRSASRLLEVHVSASVAAAGMQEDAKGRLRFRAHIGLGCGEFGDVPTVCPVAESSYDCNIPDTE